MKLTMNTDGPAVPAYNGTLSFEGAITFTGDTLDQQDVPVHRDAFDLDLSALTDEGKEIIRLLTGRILRVTIEAL